jgi:alpha-1,2-mannosyltransferase
VEFIERLAQEERQSEEQQPEQQQQVEERQPVDDDDDHHRHNNNNHNEHELLPTLKTTKSGETIRVVKAWAPRFRTALLLLISMRWLGSWLLGLADCDETFNYWEPTHYLLYGTGFQTWEYAPQYGLRSYLYVGLHALVGKIVSALIGGDKVVVFYVIRATLAGVCAACEAVFYRGVVWRFGSEIGLYTLLFLMVSPGMLAASVAFLPSSFCMYAYLLAFGCWFKGNDGAALFFGATGALVGWPFAIVVLAPMAVDMLRRRGAARVIGWGVLSALAWLVPSAAVDWLFYRRALVAVLNIFLYNATSASDGGGQLYGVEPASYYLLNGALNFSLVWALALPSIVVVALFRQWNAGLNRRKRLRRVADVLLYMSPAYLWLALMLYLPHKEERFLYVIYPLVCLNGALAFVVGGSALQPFVAALLPASNARLRRLVPPRVRKLLVVVAVAAFLALSAARIVAVAHYYRAPMALYSHVAATGAQRQGQVGGDDGIVNLCVGKEWYRFSSSFFLPDHYRLQFIRSAFGGQLPRPYAPPPNGTWIEPPNMNDRNREEPSRYIDVAECHYLVDRDDIDQEETRYALDTEQWSIEFSMPFVNAARSHPIARAFYIPYFSAPRLDFDHYVLLKRRAQ